MGESVEIDELLDQEIRVASVSVSSSRTIEAFASGSLT